MDIDQNYLPCDRSSSDSSEQIALQPKKRSRWNKADPESWLYNVEKKKRNSGQPYVKKNIIVAAKTPKPITCNKCYFKCTEKFSDIERENIYKEYWSIGNYNRKKDFILRSIEFNETARQRPRKHNVRSKTQATKYFFLKNGSKTRVCRNFFLKP